MPKETLEQYLRRKGREEDPALWNMNRLVARNMHLARQSRALTQEALGQRLEDITGRPWSKATISALERSAEGGRPRQFDADDLVAIAMALEVPLLYLFLPHKGDWHPNIRYVARGAAEAERPSNITMTDEELLLVLLGSADATAEIGAGDATLALRMAFSRVDHDELNDIGDWQQDQLYNWVQALDQIAGLLKRSMRQHTGRPDDE